MPNKENEREKVPPSVVLMASDPRHFEIDLIQREIIMSVQGQIARNSFTSHPSEELQQFVAGIRTDAATLPKEELDGHIKRLKQRQGELFEMNPGDYKLTPGMQLLKDFVLGLLCSEDFEEALPLLEENAPVSEVAEGAWPTQRSDEVWDQLFLSSVFAELAGDLDFGKSIV